MNNYTDAKSVVAQECDATMLTLKEMPTTQKNYTTATGINHPKSFIFIK